MERMLEKLAHQLNSLDEASLMALWGRFAERVEQFEPTERWEEAALCLSMCQAVRWKNQLFNHHFAASVNPDKGPDSHAPTANVPHMPPVPEKTQTPPPKPGKILIFEP